MISTKYLLIGGGLAASQAAKQLRESDPEGTITLVSEEPYVPYDRPPLSKEFLRQEKATNDLFFDPEQYFHDHQIALRLSLAVKGLDPSTKTATLADGNTIKFEKALLATGGRPISLNLPGSTLPGVLYLRTLEDSAAIGSFAEPGKRAVVIGAGFIGMEVAASLTQRGVDVTVIEAQPHIWPRFFDASLARIFQDYFTQKGVTFHTDETVREFLGQDRVSSVLTTSGKNLVCDLVCIGIGIVPNVELARQAGLVVEDGIVVNEFLQSSHPDIYAAGDVANYPDPYFKKRRRVEHWGHAEYCGQLAGQNMAGAQNPYNLLTYVWSELFDLHLECAGDETEHDQILLRGRPQDMSFIALYLKEHSLRAYFAIDTGSKDFLSLQRLIKNRKDLSGKEVQLQDPSVPIKSFL